MSKEKKSTIKRKSLPKKKKSEKTLEEPSSDAVKKHFFDNGNIIVYIVIFITILLFTSSGIFAALNLNFLLGNDVYVTLDVENEFIEVENKEVVPIDYTYSVKTNPFCATSCIVNITDLSEKKSTELVTIGVIELRSMGLPRCSGFALHLGEAYFVEVSYT